MSLGVRPVRFSAGRLQETLEAPETPETRFLFQSAHGSCFSGCSRPGTADGPVGRRHARDWCAEPATDRRGTGVFGHTNSSVQAARTPVMSGNEEATSGRQCTPQTAGAVRTRHQRHAKGLPVPLPPPPVLPGLGRRRQVRDNGAQRRGPASGHVTPALPSRRHTRTRVTRFRLSWVVLRVRTRVLPHESHGHRTPSSTTRRRTPTPIAASASPRKFTAQPQASSVSPPCLSRPPSGPSANSGFSSKNHPEPPPLALPRAPGRGRPPRVRARPPAWPLHRWEADAPSPADTPAAATSPGPGRWDEVRAPSTLVDA